MKNLKISKRAMRRGLALVCFGTILTGTMVLSVSGKLPSDGRDDYIVVQERVNDIFENRRKKIIRECGLNGERNHFSSDRINYEIYRRLEEEHLLKPSEKEAYARYKLLFDNSQNSYDEDESALAFSIN